MPRHQLLSTGDARHASESLLEAQRRSRDADRAAVPERVPGLREIDVNPAIIEQAKGALMLRYGINSYQAFAVLVRWSRVSHTPVHTIAHALLHGVCEGNPQTENRQGPLIRWLEDQLRHGDPDLARLPTAPVGSRTGA
jgi:hypothetical protein